MLIRMDTLKHKCPCHFDTGIYIICTDVTLLRGALSRYEVGWRSTLTLDRYLPTQIL